MKKDKALALVDPLVLKGICHRGLHNDIYPENSLGAFNNAIIHNLAFELDIHLTLDGYLVVCHDSNLLRTIGKDGLIEELTLRKIKEEYQLFDGSEIPTLEEVIDLNQERVPIFIELKSYNHNSTKLALKLKEILKNVKNRKKYVLISFFPKCLFPFKGEGFQRELLVGNDTYYLFSLRHLFEGVDVSLNLFNKASVRRYAKKHFVNCFTVDNESKLEFARKFATTFTFEKIEL